MALTDINFQQAEGQDFILEFALGSLGTPNDITVGDENTAYLYEIPRSGGNIFIMSE